MVQVIWDKQWNAGAMGTIDLKEEPGLSIAVEDTEHRQPPRDQESRARPWIDWSPLDCCVRRSQRHFNSRNQQLNRDLTLSALWSLVITMVLFLSSYVLWYTQIDTFPSGGNAEWYYQTTTSLGYSGHDAQSPKDNPIGCIIAFLLLAIGFVVLEQFAQHLVSAFRAARGGAETHNCLWHCKRV